MAKNSDQSRRRFMQGAAGLAFFSTAGCDRIDEFLNGSQEDEICIPPEGQEVDLVSHAISRMSFGQTPGEYGRVRSLGETQEAAVEAYLEEQLSPDEIRDRRAQRGARRFEALAAPLGEMYEFKEEHLLEQLTRATLLRAIKSKRQLFEMMVHFWSDHFNIDSSKEECRWLKAADDREVIRKNSMGKFVDLIRASVMSPAMLWYLDGRENRVDEAGDRPNENYARELLELHTLGVGGGYTQQDVMEVARCLSGWTVRGKERFFKGRVEFNSSAHDDGSKIVLGHEISSGGGKNDLEEVIKIVCAHPSTAKHIARKLCVRFLNDEPSESSVEDVAKVFSDSGGEIPKVLKAVFSTREFLEGSRRNKLKRPFELIVSALRATGSEVKSEKGLIEYLVRMGHAPFQYPTPDGYPDESSPWTGTLLWRWHFAVALSRNEIDSKIQFDEDALLEKAGGTEELAAVFLGRRPTAPELESLERIDEPTALLLSTPAFQWR